MSQVTRAQKVRLGVFLALGLSALIGGMAVLTGLKLGEKRDPYTIRYSEAAVSLSGLDVGAPVKYSGIRVGRVDSVRIDPKDVGVILVEISLDHGTPVAEDEKANLGSQGITGLKYIELTRGSSGARVRAPGGEIPPGSSLMDTLANQAGDIATKVEVVLDRVAVLTGPEIKDRIASVLERSEKLLTTLEALLAENRESLQGLAKSVDGTSQQIEKLATALAGTAGRANALLDAATLLLKNASLTPARVNDLLEEITTIFGPEGMQRTIASLNTLLAQNRHQLVETISFVREAAENLSALSQKLRDDPTLLLRHEDESASP